MRDKRSNRRRQQDYRGRKRSPMPVDGAGLRDISNIQDKRSKEQKKQKKRGKKKDP